MKLSFRKTTTRFTFLLPALFTFALWGCDEQGSDDEFITFSTTYGPHETCTFSGLQIILNDLVIPVPEYDQDENFCLDNNELDLAIEAETERKESRSVDGEIFTEWEDLPSITAISVQGNAEPVDTGRAEIHTNIDNGRFLIRFNLAVPSDAPETRLKLFFHGKSIEEIFAGDRIFGNYLTLSPLTPGKVILVCDYQTNFQFQCALPGGEPFAIDDSEKFSDTPEDAYFHAIVCDSETCYSNYASVPIRLN